MNAMHRLLHLQRVVIVTPSVYGTDNASTLDGIRTRGADARGIAVINDQTPESELDAMGRAGIRGIRLNLSTGGTNDPDVARDRFVGAIERMRGRDWHIQSFTSLQVIAALKDIVASSPVPVVFDHFGGAKAVLGTQQPGFADLLALVRSGKAYVKISGADSASTLAPDFPDAVPLARALIAANPDRILWGSNWPHPGTAGKIPTDVTPLRQVDDGHMLNLLAAWEPIAAIRRKILVDNPARLFGF
jgi:predicted TIM-barrel fold metal-dependent hydrolase